MKKRRLYKRITFVSLLLAGLVMSSCSGHESGEKKVERVSMPSVRVTTSASVGQDLPVQIVVTGVVQASERASIAPKVMGTISSFPVGLGQRVKAGDLLVKIDAAEITAKVLQAEVQLKQASRDLEREKALLEKGASTSEIVKNLTDRVSMVEAMVGEAHAMRGYMELRAPFDGSVARTFSDVGSLASPGMPLLELEGDRGLEIEVGVPESLLGGLKIGGKCRVLLPSSSEDLEAELVEISSGFDVSSRTGAVRFALPASSMARVGQYAKVTLEGESRPMILVPESAVLRNGQMERVFVVENGVAQLRLVKTGAKRGGVVEILSGLDADEQVVVKSQIALTDGQTVTR